MAKYAIFTLSMPNNNSWNGKWSGSEQKYVVARTLVEGDLSKIKDDSCYRYSFGDGWCAGISVQVVDGAKEKNKLIKGSTGFCGYDWMVNSIMKHNKIICED